MHLYNTLSGKKEELTKPSGRPLHLFVCGPTVYDHSHIGHARTYLTFDTLVRYLRARGWDVFYLQNITDVDDKIIARAREQGMNPRAFASLLTKEYAKDMRALGVRSVTKYAPAHAFIPDIVRQVETLKTKGFAYTIDGDGIYYDISKFPDYGKLSRRTAAQAEDAVSRIDDSVRKRNRGDFCLWKFPKAALPKTKRPPRPFLERLTKDGEPAWWTPLGWGRPGWHIEDTAITEKYFGPQYDIHGGAQDLKFPHHEAEIAQQEAASGKKPFVRIWMHTGLLIVEGKKMSKSLGNFLTIRDFLAAHSPDTLRWMTLVHHYRSPMNYTAELVAQAETALATLAEFLERLALIARKQKNVSQHGNAAVALSAAERRFDAALNDDWNTPEALATLFHIQREFDRSIWNVSRAEARQISKTLKDLLAALGIAFKPATIPANIMALADERELCRTNKQFTHADDLRKKLRTLGYEVDDTPIGPFIRKLRP